MLETYTVEDAIWYYEAAGVAFVCDGDERTFWTCEEE